MNLEIALVHGLIWAIMWGSTVTFTEIKWPHLFLHDYPKELQEVINLPPFTNKKYAYVFETIAMFLIIVFIFWSAIHAYTTIPVSYWVIFCHILIVAMCWNIFDLIVMDWLIFCTWQPKFIVLPGSEGNKAYKDYKFHFIGFLKGSVISAISSIVIAGICFSVLKYLIW
ncbi:hypothetical protein [Haloimpatiens massiliensis]|uniref:hypothetical protein n=1 Tax=Haloimpatiens massiliensis TaxID=1658110 RepID=UPI000C840F7B|nr:hypothetical protein [Haloimpatiens massiliensis]